MFTVVDVGSNYPTKKSINIMSDKDFKLEARYSMEECKFPVRDDFIAMYDVKVKYNELKSEKARKLKVYFEVDNFGIFNVTDVIAIQEYDVEEKIPVKKKW